MSTYTACTGSQQTAIDAHKVNVNGLGSKFSHMRGKTYGACPACGRTGLVVRANGTVPAHKAAEQTPATVHIRRTDEVNITECGRMTDYDAVITDAPIGVPSDKGIAVFPDVETPAGPQCQACWHAFTEQTPAVAPITVDSSPAGIFAAMMRANASESAAPQSRLYGLLSDYLRRTLTREFGAVAAEHIYAAALSSGEFSDETIPYGLESVQYGRTEQVTVSDLAVGDTISTDVGPVLLVKDNGSRGLLSVRNFTGRILSIPAVPDHCTWILRSNVVSGQAVDYWAVQGAGCRLFARYAV